MRFTADSPATTKNNREPRFATGRYSSLARVISAFVVAASASFAAISTLLAFAFSSVPMSSSLSKMFPCSCGHT